jgi:hypothetical protein
MDIRPDLSISVSCSVKRLNTALEPAFDKEADFIIFSENFSHSAGGKSHKQLSIPLVIIKRFSGKEVRAFTGNIILPFSSIVFLYSPVIPLLSTFFYLLPLFTTDFILTEIYGMSSPFLKKVKFFLRKLQKKGAFEEKFKCKY